MLSPRETGLMVSDSHWLSGEGMKTGEGETFAKPSMFSTCILGSESSGLPQRYTIT